MVEETRLRAAWTVQSGDEDLLTEQNADFRE